MRFGKHFKRFLCIFLCVLLGACAVTAAINAVALRGFYRIAQKEFEMPGMDDAAYCPQGMDYDADTGLFFFTGYMRTSEANPIYMVDPESGACVKCVRLAMPDGTPMHNHAGGVAVTDTRIYTAGSTDCCLYVFDKAAVMNAENGGTVQSIGAFPLQRNDDDRIRASFVTKDGNMIYVGEFAMPILPWFRMCKNHTVETETGKTNALLVGFPINRKEKLGLDAKPAIAYALPDRVQGAYPYRGQFVLSKSFGYLPGRISFAEPVPAGTITILNTEMPLYALRETREQTVIPMSEEIVVQNDRVLISSELYNYIIPRIGALWDGRQLWSIPVG